MSGERGLERAPHVRPVADAPVERLLARTDDLAKRWVIALLDARPLQELADVPLGGFAREAPALCEALIRALSSERELEQIVAGGRTDDRERVAPWPSTSLAGSGQPQAVVRELETLRGVLWEAALSELREPSVGQVADLSDRLAFVCSAALATQLAEGALADAPEAPERRPRDGEPRQTHEGERVLYRSKRSPTGRRRAILIDERDDDANPSSQTSDRPVARERVFRAAGERTAASHAPSRSAGEPRRQPPLTGRPLPWDTPLQVGRPSAHPADASVGGPPAATRGEEPVMRITRRPSAPVDERA